MVQAQGGESRAVEVVPTILRTGESGAMAVASVSGTRRGRMPQGRGTSSGSSGGQ